MFCYYAGGYCRNRSSPCCYYGSTLAAITAEHSVIAEHSRNSRILLLRSYYEFRSEIRLAAITAVFCYYAVFCRNSRVLLLRSVLLLRLCSAITLSSAITAVPVNDLEILLIMTRNTSAQINDELVIR